MYPDLSFVKKILVIKLRHHGDVLLSSPVFSILKQAMPQAKIDAYLYKETLPMLDGHPTISSFILYDQLWKKRFFTRLKKEFSLLNAIRKEKYDLVINLTEGDRGALAAFISKAKIRVGFDPEGSGFWQKKRFYTHTARVCHQLRHAVERNLDVIRCLGLFPNPIERKVTFHIPEEAKQKVSMLLELEGFHEKDFILIHPVSRWHFKCWPAEKFAHLIRILHEEGKKIVLTSSPDPLEMAIIGNILQKIPDISLCNLAGKTTLKELGALIEKAQLLITVDSMPLHLSSALKVPVVAIFGPTSEVNWAPWQNPQSRIVSEHISCRPCYMPGCGGSHKSDCLETLSVNRVYHAVEQLLQTCYGQSVIYQEN